MPAAKTLPLEELVASKESLGAPEFAERWRIRTGYGPEEIVPIPKALMLLSGTKRPARARERITGYLRFGIPVTDQRRLAKEYIEAPAEDSFEELLAAHTQRRKFSEAEINRFFETLGRHENRPKRDRGLSCFELLHWTKVFAEVRKTLRQTASARSGFQHRSVQKSGRKSLDT
jgi:hypothetical protein